MSDEIIRDVIKRHTDKLMAINGVVGVGEGRHQGTPCILLFVVDKNSGQLKHLPDNIEGYLLKIEESGEFRAFGN